MNNLNNNVNAQSGFVLYGNQQQMPAFQQQYIGNVQTSGYSLLSQQFGLNTQMHQSALQCRQNPCITSNMSSFDERSVVNNRKRLIDESYSDDISDVGIKPKKIQRFDKTISLMPIYNDYVECRYIDKGNYALSIVGKDISNEKAQEILEAFKGVNVTEIYFIGCVNITRLYIPKNFVSLKRLSVLHCNDIIGVSGFENSPNLTMLVLFRCANLENVQGLQNLKFVSYFNCSNCNKLSGTVDLSNSVALNQIVKDNTTGNLTIKIHPYCRLATLSKHNQENPNSTAIIAVN